MMDGGPLGHYHHHQGATHLLANGLHIQTSLPHGAMGGMSTYLVDEGHMPPPPLHHQQFPYQQQQQHTLRYSSLGMQFPFLPFTLPLRTRHPRLPTPTLITCTHKLLFVWLLACLLPLH